MMNSSSTQEDENIKENIIKEVRNLFRLKKNNKAIKDRIIRDIRNLTKHEEAENDDKLVRFLEWQLYWI